MKKTLVIILLGRSGCGKGTQAELLQKKFGLEYVGSGDILRARSKNKDFTGMKLEQVMNRGEIAPTAIIFKLWLDILEGFKKKRQFRGFIMDGSPRRILEAQLIDQALEWYGWQKHVKVLLIDISRQEAFNRLSKRRICAKCGRLIPYLGEFKELKVCDKCGGKLRTRSDDSPAAIKERFDFFEKEVRPALNYYKKQRKLIRINGEQSIEGVFQDILKALNLK